MDTEFPKGIALNPIYVLRQDVASVTPGSTTSLSPPTSRVIATSDPMSMAIPVVATGFGVVVVATAHDLHARQRAGYSSDELFEVVNGHRAITHSPATIPAGSGRARIPAGAGEPASMLRARPRRYCGPRTTKNQFVMQLVRYRACCHGTRVSSIPAPSDLSGLAPSHLLQPPVATTVPDPRRGQRKENPVVECLHPFAD